MLSPADLARAAECSGFVARCAALITASPSTCLNLGSKQVRTVPRRLLHLDNAIVLWLDRRILHLASIKLAYSITPGTGSTFVIDP